MRIRLLIMTATLALAACGGSGEAASGGPAVSEAGERAWRQCAVCHTSAPPDTPAGQVRLIGPNLFGVYGGPAAQVEGFAYSPALKSAEIVWDDAALDAYLTNPQALVRGTRMAFPGVRDPADRQAIIDYLKTLK